MIVTTIRSTHPFGQNIMVMPTIEKTKTTYTLSIALFAIGLVTGLLFYTVALWGRLEASQFEPPVMGDEPLESLRCPTLITPNETSYASAWIENPTDRPMPRFVETRISEGSVIFVRELEERIDLQPGEQYELVWPMTASDAAWGRMILLHATVLRNNTFASQSGVCGVVVANVPFVTGRQLSAALLTTTVLGLVAGTGMWWAIHRPVVGQALQKGQMMAIFTLILLIGLLVTLTGQWIFGLGIFAILLLFSVTTFAR